MPNLLKAKAVSMILTRFSGDPFCPPSIISFTLAPLRVLQHGYGICSIKIRILLLQPAEGSEQRSG